MSGASLGFLIFFWGLIIGGIVVSLRTLIKAKK